MNTRSHSTSSTQCLLLACALLITPAIRSYAQLAAPADQKTKEEPKEGSVIELSPFQVTAKEDNGYFKKNTMAGTRSAERLINIPQNIQIITRELMDDIPTDNTPEVLKYGASGINKRTTILGDMFMRGFRVRTFLRDNIGYASNINAPLYDIDRIEVVKGPAAMVYGQSSSTGGAINYVTKIPTGTANSDVMVTTGTFNLMRVTANASGPVGDTGLGYRGTFATTKGDGRGKFDYNKDIFLGSTLLYKLSDTSSVQLDWLYSGKDEIVSARGVGIDGKLIKLPNDFTYFEPWVYGKTYTYFTTLTFRSALSPTLTMQALANFSRAENDWDRVTPNGLPDAAGILRRNFQELFFDSRSGNQQTDFLQTFKPGSIDHKLSFGWNISYGQSGPNNITTIPIAALNIFNPVYNTPKPNYNRNLGAFGRSLTGSLYMHEQASLLKGKLILVGGFRYNKFHSTSLSQVTATSSERNDQAWVKRYGAIFKPIESVSVYYNYSESFIFNTSLVVGGPNDGALFSPSYGVNKEIGVKVETPDGHISGSISYFDLSLTNVYTLYTLPPNSKDRFGNPIPGDLGIRQGAGENNNGAFEADIGLSFESPLGPWQAILTYYEGNQLNTEGIQPNSVVNNTWSLLANQAFAKGTFKGLKIGAGAFHRGECPGVGPLKGTPGWYLQPAYTTTTAFVNYSRGHYRLALSVDNLADKRDMIEGGETGFWLYVVPGRTVQFSVAYRF